jgi:LmbE family N-acetylglucosaminyl deacetylase
VRSLQLISIPFVSWGLLLPAQTPYSTSIAPSSVAQEIPANRGAAAVWQSLKKLRTRASLIMITAHPDDEDGGMLTYESRGRGTRVAMLTLNRGEGGANVMSSDFYDALGLVRTEELLKAGQYYGVEQYFTRVVDYGFSKTMDESMKRWTRERVLYDVVRVVRMVRPLVITSVFVGGTSDGHGNHQTAGAMAKAVFAAAGDPNVFPDQIREGLRPWNPLKHYGRRPGVQLSTEVEVPQGTYDPLLGASYAQIAREGLGWQKSQNGGPSVPKAGEILSVYHRFSPPAQGKEAGFFDGIDVTLGGIATLAPTGGAPFLKAGLARIESAVKRATEAFSAVQPEKSAPALAEGLRETMALLDQVTETRGLSDDAKYNIRHELEIKRAQFNNALALSLGLSVSATVAPEREPSARMLMFFGDPETFRVAIPGQRFGVKVHVVNPSTSAVTLVRTKVTGTADEGHGVEIANNKPVDTRAVVTVPPDAPYTRPYFQRPDIGQAYYDIADTALLHRPAAPYPYAVEADFAFQGTPIRLLSVVQSVKRVNGLGTVYEPLVVGPAIGVAIAPHYGVVPMDAKSFPVSVALHSNVKGPASGTVRLDLPQGWKSEPASAPFAMAADGEERSVRFTVTPENLTEKAFPITAVAEYGGKEYREGYSLAGYPGLRSSYLYRPAVYKTSGVNVKVAEGLKVAYVAGSGDEVPASLEHLGIKVQFLTAADLATGNLKQFDAVVLGIRAYAARPELATYNARLLEYVNDGGLMIVQYNTPEFDKNFGPYPYAMGNNPEEVTDEASKVELLLPDHPLLQWPNRITEKDFEGWVEERGSKWMRNWDPRYQALLEAHDEGQDPQKGGMLYAKYGKGVWVYSAWAFYRQLPEGVPGAFRIFANLLSVGKNAGR